MNTDITTTEPDQLTAPSRSMLETATTRAAQEVQAAMVIAKKFPRDENASYSRIMRACQRKSLAEQAEYAYPRGGTTVSGPSIRLAEMLAQNWGNIDSGITELEQKTGESIMLSYAWDLETNSRQSRTFTVKHERHTKTGVQKLTDPRDIYEMCANQGARRLRACILGVIPGDVVDAALEKCEQTLKGDGSEPLADRARKMVVAFEGMGVTQVMIEQRMGHKLDAIIEQELVNLRKIYNSLNNGAAKREDFFTVTGAAKPTSEPPKTKAKAADEPIQKATPAEGIANLCKSSGIKEAVLLGYLFEQGATNVAFSTLAEIPEPVLENVKAGWPSILDALTNANSEPPAQQEPPDEPAEIPTDHGDLVKFLRAKAETMDLDEKQIVKFAVQKKWCGAVAKQLSDIATSGLKRLAENIDAEKDAIAAL